MKRIVNLVGNGLLGFLLVIGLFRLNQKVSWAAVSDWQQSASIVSTSTTDFGSESFKRSLDNLSKTGANMVTLIIPYYQNSTSSNSIYRGFNTPTDAALEEAIRYAHSIGLQVTLKTHIETESGDWRAYIDPSNRDQWYGEYATMLGHYAQIAERHGVKQMVVGAEMWKTSSDSQNSNNTARWEHMIGEVRNSYSGNLTYSSNHSYPREVEEVAFWNTLDYIGVAAYFPLAEHINEPTVEDLRASWDHWNNTVLRPIHEKWGKPILFTEIGYRSVDGAHKEPFSWWREGAVDEEEQARDYEALFSYWNNQSYFKGVHLWDWKTTPNPEGEGAGYTPQNKQAEMVMAIWFDGSEVGGPGSEPSPTTTPTPEPGFEPANYIVSASADPNSGTVGQEVSWNVHVKPDREQHGAVIDIEIYNESGQMVRQVFYENQHLPANNQKSFTVNWTPNAVGRYRLAVGIFAPQWQYLITWENEVGYVTITNGGVSPSPTPTGTPTPTSSIGSTPTPTPESPTPTPTQSEQNQGELAVWWPDNGARLQGTQPFKAMVSTIDISQYRVIWRVDGGQENSMFVSQEDYPHYESLVDLGSWRWNGNGPYNVMFVAYRNDGSKIGEETREIYVN